MPRHQLTPLDRRKAAAKTNKIIAEKKRKRIERVRQLLRDGKTTAEMAKLLDVSERTIKRDLDAIESEISQPD